MSIYTDANNEFVISITEWCKNNPLDITELGHEKVAPPCSFTGMIHSEKTKEIMSQSHKGKHKPWLQSEETKAKRKESSIGKKMPPRSEEWKAKQRLSQLGKKRKPFTEEHIQNLSIANKNRTYGPLTEEHKENISKGLRNRKKIIL
jgi:hypothetical protein